MEGLEKQLEEVVIISEPISTDFLQQVLRVIYYAKKIPSDDKKWKPKVFEHMDELDVWVDHDKNSRLACFKCLSKKLNYHRVEWRFRQTDNDIHIFITKLEEWVDDHLGLKKPPHDCNANETLFEKGRNAMRQNYQRFSHPGYHPYQVHSTSQANQPPATPLTVGIDEIFQMGMELQIDLQNVIYENAQPSIETDDLVGSASMQLSCFNDF